MLTNNSQRCQADFMWVADRFFEAQGNRLGACEMQKGTATAKLLSLTSISFPSISELRMRFHQIGGFSPCFIVFSGGCQSECTVLCSIESLSSAPSTFASRAPSFSLEQVAKQLQSSCKAVAEVVNVEEPKNCCMTIASVEGRAPRPKDLVFGPVPIAVAMEAAPQANTCTPPN